MKLSYLILLMWTSGVLAMSPQAIVEKSYDFSDGNSMTGEIRMEIYNQTGEKKERTLSIMRVDPTKDSSKYLMKVLTPSSIRNTAFLSWTFRNKKNKQWIYLKSLKRVRRIGSSALSQNFIGSDFSYDDLSKRSLNRDKYELVKKAKCFEGQCFVIKATSKEEEEYPVKYLWIRTEDFFVTKVEFEKENVIAKRFEVLETKKIGPYLAAIRSRMDNLKEKTKTLLFFSKIKFDQKIDKKVFDKKRLKK